MKPFPSHPERGSLILLVMCLLAVLGIALAGYLAVSNQAMKLANRSYAKDVSKNLAEMGLERALLSFTTNNWSSWTKADGTALASTDTTAYRTISFANTKYGTSGIIGTAKIRVDNFNTHNLSSTWNAVTTYKLNDVVAYSGMWYRCVVSNTNQTPTATGNLDYWVPAPISWTWSSDITYARHDVVNYLGTWYRCVPVTLTSATVPSGSNPDWKSIPSISLSWSSAATYAQGAIVFNNGSWYSSIAAGNTNNTPPNATYWKSADWTASTAYARGKIVYYSGTWYSCKTAHTSGASFVSTNWNSAYWTASTAYTIGCVAFNSGNGTWYYCKTAHTSGASFSATNWKVADWTATTAYAVNDAVNYGGSWYTCSTAHTSSPLFATDLASKWTVTDDNNFISWQYLVKNPRFDEVSYYSTSGAGTWYRRDVSSTAVGDPTNTSYWENALTGSWAGNSLSTYNLGDVVNVSGTFYRCILAHSGHTPPNTTYWTTDPLFSPAWDPGKLYSLDDSTNDTGNDTVSYNGNWYLYINATPSTGKNPAWESAYWAVAPRTIAAWDATKAYSVDDLVSSGGAWYRCISNHTNQAVSNASYWIAMAGYANQWNASTSYSAGTYVSYGGAWYKCTLAPTANQTPNNNTYWTPTWTNSYGVSMGAPVIYTEGTANLLDGSAIKTQVRAAVAPAALFPNAAGSATTLTLGGAGTVDSYDGSVASLTTGGVSSNYVYNTSTAPFTSSPNLSYAATLASGYITSTAIIGGTGTVQGYLAAPASTTLPHAPLSSFNGTLKGTAAGTGIDLTRFSRSPYIPDFDVQTPAQHTSMPNSTISLGTPGATTPSVYYYSTNLSLASTITINGPVILYINGYLRLNTGSIVINSTGSAEIHFTYLRVYSGSAGFVNKTLDPKKLVLLGTIAGNSTNYLIAPTPATNYFYGVIFLPDTTATLGLDIRTGNIIYGAVSAREVTFSAEANLHYDTSLRYAKIPGVDQPYTVSEWRELTDPAERAVLP